MKIIFFSCLGICFLLSAKSVMAAPKTSSSPPIITPVNNINSFDDYHKECLKRVKQQGFTDDIGQDICKCTMAKFRSKYSLKQFKDLVQKAKTDKASARKLSEVGENCFENILYDQ